MVPFGSDVVVMESGAAVMVRFRLTLAVWAGEPESVARKVRGVAFTWLVGVDRKSTRLNSSHLVISYAVFCLKKHYSKTHVESTASKFHALAPVAHTRAG